MKQRKLAIVIDASGSFENYYDLFALGMQLRKIQKTSLFTSDCGMDTQLLLALADEYEQVLFITDGYDYAMVTELAMKLKGNIKVVTFNGEMQ
jgi:hypothetical protein